MLVIYLIKIHRFVGPLGLLAVLLCADRVFAQSPVGTRAEGMAGAFVGVADDATAVYWNPAGIASGSFVSAVVSFGAGPELPESAQTSADQRDRRAVVAFSATAIGLAYYRVTAYGSTVDEPAVSGSPSREEVGRSVHGIATSTLGVSLLQSLTDHIVVGATPKFVHGADSSVADVDAGVMFSRKHIRVGLVARNLTSPSFETEEGAIDIDRELRAGAAWGSGWTGISRVIVSVDGDLTSRVSPTGDRRDVAAGVETWWLGQRLGVRGGARRSTIGEARGAIAAGVSAGLRPGMLVEAHVVRGHTDERSWSIGARMLF
jgi:hypothetical protein